MKAVKVSRDYDIEIDFAVDFEQLGVSVGARGSFREDMKNTA